MRRNASTALAETASAERTQTSQPELRQDLLELRNRFAAAVTKARESRGLTQRALALMVNVSHDQVFRIEAGRASTFDTMALVAVALNLDLNKILRIKRS
jgi:ribosome-binding protein aMBF1 (putative translation factor)